MVGWTVPAGALPPTQITLFGALFDANKTLCTSVQGFNDTTTFSSNLREVTTAPCSIARVPWRQPLRHHTSGRILCSRRLRQQLAPVGA